MSTLTNKQSGNGDKGDKAVVRLPCRGCTKACDNFKRCEGMPWRTLGEKNNKL